LDRITRFGEYASKNWLSSSSQKWQMRATTLGSLISKTFLVVHLPKKTPLPILSPSVSRSHCWQRATAAAPDRGTAVAHQGRGPRLDGFIPPCPHLHCCALQLLCFLCTGWAGMSTRPRFSSEWWLWLPAARMSA
jgi:hypothetical protein